MAFEIVKELSGGKVLLDSWPLCEVLFVNDALYPGWLVLVPRRTNAREIFDLTVAEQNPIPKRCREEARILCIHVLSLFQTVDILGVGAERTLIFFAVEGLIYSRHSHGRPRCKLKEGTDSVQSKICKPLAVPDGSHSVRKCWWSTMPFSHAQYRWNERPYWLISEFSCFSDPSPSQSTVPRFSPIAYIWCLAKLVFIIELQQISEQFYLSRLQLLTVEIGVWSVVLTGVCADRADPRNKQGIQGSAGSVQP